MKYCFLIFTKRKLERFEIIPWWWIFQYFQLIFSDVYNIVHFPGYKIWLPNPRFSTQTNIGLVCKHEKAMICRLFFSSCSLLFTPDQSFYSCILFSSNKSYVPATKKPEKLSKSGLYIQLVTTTPAQKSGELVFVACAPCSNNDTKPFDNLFFSWTNIFQKQQRANGGNRNKYISKPETTYTVCKIRQYFRPWLAWKVIFKTLVF